MNDELVMICGKCRQPVGPHKGCLWVGHDEIRDRRGEKAEWDRRHSGRSLRLSEMLGMPEDIHWKVHHDGCTPEPAEPYWIATEDIGNYDRLLHWTAHLMAKTWFSLTDWDSLLREIAGEGGPSPRMMAAIRAAA